MSFFNKKQIRIMVIECLSRRDGSHCCYCCIPLGQETATLEHIVPKSHGGTRAIFNLALACSRCNNRRQTADFIKTLTKHKRPQEVINRFKTIIITYKQLRFFQKCVNQIKSSTDPETVKNKSEILDFYGGILRKYSLRGIIKNMVI